MEVLCLTTPNQIFFQYIKFGEHPSVKDVFLFLVLVDAFLDNPSYFNAFFKKYGSQVFHCHFQTITYIGAGIFFHLYKIAVDKETYGKTKVIFNML